METAGEVRRERQPCASTRLTLFLPGASFRYQTFARHVHLRTGCHYLTAGLHCPNPSRTLICWNIKRQDYIKMRGRMKGK